MNRERTPVFTALTAILTAFVLFMSTMTFAAQNTQKRKLPLKDVQRFTNAISQIKNYYVEPISDSKLFENAIRGMLQGLDPHSAYLNKDEFRELTSSTQGKFGGLGIEVSMEKGVIKVIAPIDDTPAYRAGVKAGDLIIRLDNTPIKGMSLREAIKKMRGKRGSIVTLMILRKGEKKPLNIKIVRDVIKVKSVKYKILEDGYGYIRLSHFQVPSANNLSTAVKLLHTQAGGKLKGLILDLRNNPGGLLDSAIEISNVFLDSRKLGSNKIIVYTEGRVPGAHFSAKATPGDILHGAPIIVLINNGSASASEIVAGALQDHKRAILMGTGSFGKGSVQTVLPLDDLTGVKLTTALYFTPHGRSIQAKGIKPDIIVKHLNIPKEKKDEITRLKEANLQGHLDNGKSSRATSKAEEAQPAKKKKTSNLVYDDYTLFEALNVLKGMVILQNVNEINKGRALNDLDV